ncbi:hypothetical protein K0M31_018771 [Melipona bicolor]|uniref:Uncharacterized protein n=1 Tax=Melipona bicolor TaxID=60889 RepID=A0AA40G4H1_9HYME|nr:hypothetical protein K0M31_018771 [Melipona bicolor]
MVKGRTEGGTQRWNRTVQFSYSSHDSYISGNVSQTDELASGVRLNIWVTSKGMSTKFDEANYDVRSLTTRKRGHIPEINNTGTIKN